MSFLVVLVVDHVEQVPVILEGWEAAGAPGVTIINSTGLGRMRRAGLRDDFPLMPSLRDLFDNEETFHRTLFSVVETQAQVDAMIRVAQDAIGDLEQAHTGFLFVAPVLQAVGMGKHRGNRRGE
jgi:nitrogen regulatory protein PII